MLTMTAYESFLFFIGSVFVPLFGILAADHFAVRRDRVDVPALYARDGKYWFTGGFRVAALVPWVLVGTFGTGSLLVVGFGNQKRHWRR